MTSYLDDVIGVVRTQEDGVVALAAGGDAGALIGLRKHDVKSVCVDGPRLISDRLAMEVLGAHISNADAVSEALVQAVHKVEPMLERLARWDVQGHSHLVFTLMSVCTVASKAHWARVEVPSQAAKAQRIFARRIFALLRGMLGVAELSAEQELLATLPDGLRLPLVHLGLEYAASVLLGCGVMRGRGIELRVESVAEAQALVQRGIDNISLLPAVDYESWTVAEMKGLQSRFLEREHLARFEPLVTLLLANPSPQNSGWLSRLLENRCPLSRAWMSSVPGRTRAVMDSATVLLGIRARLLLSAFPQGASRAACGCGVAVALEDQFSAESIAGEGPAFGSPVGEELFQEDSDVPAHVDAAAAAYAAEVVRLAHGAVVEATAGLALRSDWSHSARCLYAARLRTVRHDAACACLQNGYRAAGYDVVREVPTGVGQKRGDLLIAELGKHFDLSIVTLDEVVDGGFPALELGAGLARGVKTAEQERAFRAWLVAAQGVAFGAMARQAAFKRAHHAPAQVTPLILSAGGAISREDDELLPCPADRNGRHWTRVELSVVLLKYRCKLAWQMWSRRGPVVQQAAA